MTRQYPFSSKLRKMKAMLKLLWPLLIVKLVENSGFNLTRNSIFCSAAYFNLPCDTRQDSKNSRFHAGRRWPIFGAKLEAWTHKMFHIFRFLKSYMVLAIINPFSWIFNAISREKSCLIPIFFFSMLLLLAYIHVRIAQSSRLLNPDWSIHRSNFRRASLCKVHWMQI